MLSVGEGLQGVCNRPHGFQVVGLRAHLRSPRTAGFQGKERLSITLDALFLLWHNVNVAWEVEGTDEFAGWFGDLTDNEQVSVGRVVELLVEHGPSLPFPYSSGIATSRHRHMRELRIQHEGRPYRVLYAFDPRRAAILLLGGDKTGNDRWYDEHVPIADRLYDEYLRELEREGLT